MINFLIYLLKAGAWLVPFYLLYILLFRRFSFYSLNRLYLLVSLVVAFLLPLVNYTMVVKKEIQAPRLAAAPLVTGAGDEEIITSTPSLPVEAATNTINITQVLFLLYIAVAAFMLFRLLKNLHALYRIIHASEKERSGKLRLVYAPGKTGHASFFNYILLDAKKHDDKDFSLIIAHERVHVQKIHSIDILLCELVKILLWFNPFVALYKRSFSEVHEFEADALAAQHADKKTYASSLLQMAIHSHNGLLSTYSRHPLKTRITRLFQPQTSNMKKLLFLLVIPVTVCVLIAFRSINRKTVPVWVNAPLVVMVDAGHGGNEPGVQIGSVTEKALTLAISEQVKKHAEALGMKVIMTRTADENISINDRIQKAVTEKPDIILSVHLNSGMNPESKGIEIYAGNNNAADHAKASVNAANNIIQSLSGISGINTSRTLQSRVQNIGILKRTPCPAVLIECGYLSNASDLSYIIRPENQDEVAKQIVNGLVQYASQRVAPAAPAASDTKNETAVYPMEAKADLHNLSPAALIFLDGKEVSRSILPDVNPALVQHYRYFEAGNYMAMKNYGDRAKNGVLLLTTKSRKGDYAFTGEDEKAKWMEVARAYYRMHSAMHYDRVQFTDINGKMTEMMVMAGGKQQFGESQLIRFMVYNRTGAGLGTVNYIVDGRTVTENEFREAINILPIGGYEWIDPREKLKDSEGKTYNVEIKKLGMNALAMPLPDDRMFIEKTVYIGENGEGC